MQTYFFLKKQRPKWYLLCVCDDSKHRAADKLGHANYAQDFLRHSLPAAQFLQGHAVLCHAYSP